MHGCEREPFDDVMIDGRQRGPATIPPEGKPRALTVVAPALMPLQLRQDLN